MKFGSLNRQKTTIFDLFMQNNSAKFLLLLQYHSSIQTLHYTVFFNKDLFK